MSPQTHHKHTHIARDVYASASEELAELTQRHVLTIYLTSTITRAHTSTTPALSSASVTHSSAKTIETSITHSSTHATTTAGSKAKATDESSVSSLAESTEYSSTVHSTIDSSTSLYSSTHESSTSASTSSLVSTSSAVPTSSVPTLTTITRTSSPLEIASVTSTSAASTSSIVVVSPDSSRTSSSSGSDSSASSTASSTISDGAKAGISIGIILGAGIIAFLIFMVVKKVRKQSNEQQSKNVGDYPKDNNSDVTLPVPVYAHDSTPRLSINIARPMSGLLPLSLLSGRMTRNSAGNLQKTNMSQINEEKIYSKPAAAESIRDSISSSGSSITEVEIPISEKTRSQSPTSSFSDDSSSIISSRSGRSPPPSPVMIIAAPEDRAASNESTKQQQQQFQDQDQDHSDQANKSASNVHRAVMDFNPAMHDELPLKEGQLVRIIHEYDDGWVLCVRLDRSAQGVCPRACLSVRPLRPRPKRAVKPVVANAIVPIAAPSKSTTTSPKKDERPIAPIATSAVPSNSAKEPEMPSTPTIQVFAPDSDQPIEIS
ncbi:hypothetical protein V1511DRAFT_130964 [Dipodascopsis uninucleata]